MKNLKVLMLSFFMLAGSSAFSQISRCYYDFDALENGKVSTHFQQDNTYNHNIELPVSLKSQVSYSINDAHSLILVDGQGTKLASIEIQLASNKHYKQDLLTSYSYRFSAGDTIIKTNYNPEEFDIDNVRIYNTTAISYATRASCSSFFFFPKNDMSVTFQFFNCTEPKKPDDKEELKKAMDFIRSYLNQVKQCQGK